MPSVYSFTVLPVLPNTLKHLKAIAGNMFWCWNPEFVNLFRHLDSSLWTACGYNPVKLLACVPQQRLEAVAENEAFLHDLQLAYEKLQSYLKAPTWFEKVCSKTRQPLIAYFSAEFGIHECLPLYAGGLGVLAGDHLKSTQTSVFPWPVSGFAIRRATSDNISMLTAGSRRFTSRMTFTICLWNRYRTVRGTR